jgi:LEA14-like dessication related protein
VSSLRLLPETNGQRQFGVTLLLRNPNENPLEIDSIDFSIRLGSEGFVEGTIDEAATVPALGELRVRTTVSSEFVSSVSRLISFLQGPQSALPYAVSGTVWLDTRPRRDHRFAREGTVPLAISATP